MQQYKLDYDTIYNGRGREIQEMIMNYFDEKNICLVSEQPVIPDRIDRDNTVGLSIEFLLYGDMLVGCDIGMGLGFIIKKLNNKKKVICEPEFMTWDLQIKLGFSLDDDVVIEKLEIFDSVIKKVREGEEITKVDIER